MQKVIEIEIEKLRENGANPNVMSGGNFKKLVANIRRTGVYEPAAVRALEDGHYEIISGHHRVRALKELGYERVMCVVWELDEDEARLMLISLNRLRGNDDVLKKAAVVRGLCGRMDVKEIAKLLPNTRGQIEKLRDFKGFDAGAAMREMARGNGGEMPGAMVFFLKEEERKVVEDAIERAGGEGKTAAQRRADGLIKMAKSFDQSKNFCGEV